MRRFDSRVIVLFSLLSNAYAGDLLVGGYNPPAGSVLRYDQQTGAFLKAVIPSGGLPEPTGFAFGPDGYLYVASQPPSSVLRVDVNAGSIVNAFITPATSGGLAVSEIAFGPDGNFYAADFSAGNVKRYNGTTGAFMGAFTSGYQMANPLGMTFGPDGNLYVADELNIVRFNGQTGAFIDVFVRAGSNGLPVPPCGPTTARFGPDGNLYATSGCGAIAQYNGTTGAFIKFFVPAGSGGLSSPTGLAFGPDGNLYVSDHGGVTTVNGQQGQVLRYDGNMGTFLGTFIAKGSGGLYNPIPLLFIPSSNACTPSLEISAVEPSAGGNTGHVTANIRGCGFSSGVQAKLSGAGPDIIGSNTSVVNGGLVLTTTFDLTGASPGERNVVITNPDGTAGNLISGFTIQQGGSADIRVELLGRTQYRIGRDQTYYLVARNQGTIDAHGIPVRLTGIPPTAAWRIGSPLVDPPLPAGIAVDWSSIPIDFAEANGNITVPLYFGTVSAGATAVVPIVLNVPTSGSINLGAASNVPLFQSPLSESWASCGGAYLNYVVSTLGAIPGAGCITGLITHFGDEALEFVQVIDTASSGNFGVGSFLRFGAGAGIRGLDLVEACGAELNPVAATALLAYNAWKAALSFQNFIKECGEALVLTSLVAFAGNGATSVDPNAKVGPKGVGPFGYISGQLAIPYTIYFDNQPTATAPAQSVSITDTLNSKLDPNTVKLGPITVSNQVITPPTVPLSVAPFTTTVDLRPTMNLLVKIDASLNTATGVLSWTFQSVDPTTNQPPTDPLAGFLPPWAEGSVFFTVLPKSTVTTGIVIQNTATVVFDVNAPINTPTWFNTIDSTPPTSKVSALPPTEGTYSFPVQWSGTDVGAGIQDFTIYVSDNGAPFTPWLTNTTATQGLYPGLGGHTYIFYSIARDLVGNVESAKTAAEATTRVVVDTTPPVIVPQITGTLSNNGWYTSNVAVSWNVTDPESGIASSTGCSTTNLTNDIAGVTLSCTATNGVGLSTTVGVTIKIDKTPPVISGMPAAGCSLWPPNGNLIQVATMTAADALSGVAPGSFQVTGSSNEPSDDPKNPEIVITPNGSGGYSVQLQADRLGTGTGRVYTLTATAKDMAGNMATATASCTVPHDQGN